MNKTVKLFEKDVYMKSCHANVLTKDHLTYVFDQTIFFPEGGGQSADKGTIDGIKVNDVKIKNDVIYHTLEEALINDGVTMTLDWPSRLDQMQQHCGEHILSGVIKSMHDGNNKGFHIGSDYVTIDMDILITSDMLEEIEDRANESIYNNIEIEIDELTDKSHFPLRKEPTVDDNIRVVNIPEIDCVACCGTHPSRTGEVGLIKLYKVEKNKKYSRLYFKCGKRALEDYKRKTKIIQVLNNHYSSDDVTLLDRFNTEQEKFEQLKTRFVKLNRQVIDQTIKSLYNEISDFQFVRISELSNQDMTYVVKKLSELKPTITLLFSESEKKIILAHEGSFSLKCGDYFKEIKDFGGKGGGSPKSAQGKFNTLEEAEKFYNHLKAQLEVLND